MVSLRFIFFLYPISKGRHYSPESFQRGYLGTYSKVYRQVTPLAKSIIEPAQTALLNELLTTLLPKQSLLSYNLPQLRELFLTQLRY